MCECSSVKTRARNESDLGKIPSPSGAGCIIDRSGYSLIDLSKSAVKKLVVEPWNGACREGLRAHSVGPSDAGPPPTGRAPVRAFPPTGRSLLLLIEREYSPGRGPSAVSSLPRGGASRVSSEASPRGGSYFFFGRSPFPPEEKTIPSGGAPVRLP
jgi:hypothetical protein